MSMQDSISDLLTHIRNGYSANKPSVIMHSSTNKIAIVKTLQEEGYIEEFKIITNKVNKPKLEIILKYYKDKPVITKIERVSRPGLRIYKKKIDLPKILGGLGISIVSTPAGIMSDIKAKKLGHGGEILCFIE